MEDDEMVCPECGSDELKEVTAGGEYGMQCKACGWQDFEVERDD